MQASDDRDCPGGSARRSSGCSGGCESVKDRAQPLEIDCRALSAGVDLLVDLLLVRRLPPFHANVGKRLVKSPKTYVRDSGLTHALLNIETYEDLLGHPVSGPSWEGFVIENLIVASPSRTLASFYRTAAGAEIELLLELGGQRGTRAVEIKRGLSAKPQRGFYQALEDVQPARAFVVHAGEDSYPISEDIEAIGLRELAGMLSGAASEGG